MVISSQNEQWMVFAWSLCVCFTLLVVLQTHTERFKSYCNESSDENGQCFIAKILSFFVLAMYHKMINMQTPAEKQNTLRKQER